jgi:hypothetical protein
MDNFVLFVVLSFGNSASPFTFLRWGTNQTKSLRLRKMI